MTCKIVNCPAACYCLPTTVSCPGSGSTTTSCSGTISWGAESSGMQTGHCANNVTVYRCAKGYYSSEASGPARVYTSDDITCTICPGGIVRPRPGTNCVGTAATTNDAGVYSITECYIPKDSDMCDPTGTYQFKDRNCRYTQ